MTNKGGKKTNTSSSSRFSVATAKTTQKSNRKFSSGSSPSQGSAGLTSAAVSAAEVNAMAIAASLGLPLIDPVKKDIPDNLKMVIKDLMEISSGIVSENKSTKMAAVAAMKKKFSELGLFSWLDIGEDGSMRSKPGMSISSAKAQIAASLGSNTHLPISPDQLPNSIQAIVNSIDLKGLEAEWYMDAEYDELSQEKEQICTCVDGVDFQEQDVDSDLEYLVNYDPEQEHVDPVKLQMIQTAEQELSSVYSMFESDKLTDEEKLGVLKRKYMELMQHDIRHRLDNLRSKETVQAVEVERDAAKIELDKMNRLKQKLECLCAELQEENRRIKNEVLKRLDSNSNPVQQTQQKCKQKGGCPRCGCFLDTSAAFPSLPDLPEVNSLQKAGAKVLAEQLHKFVDIYRLRERHFKALIKSKETEVDVQLAKTLTSELHNDSLNQRIDSYERQVNTLTRAESDLKSQLAVYVDKFKQVEETLGKSNDLFATFRREMEQMTEKLSRLEAENGQLQAKCKTLSGNLIEMADQSRKQKDDCEALRKQKSKLEQLCRTLQAELKATNSNSSI